MVGYGYSYWLLEVRRVKFYPFPYTWGIHRCKCFIYQSNYALCTIFEKRSWMYYNLSIGTDAGGERL